jgi:hypothetical protein
MAFTTGEFAPTHCTISSTPGDVDSPLTLHDSPTPFANGVSNLHRIAWYVDGGRGYHCEQRGRLRASRLALCPVAAPFTGILAFIHVVPHGKGKKCVSTEQSKCVLAQRRCPIAASGWR